MLLCHIKVVAVEAFDVFSNSSMITIYVIFFHYNYETTVPFLKHISELSSIWKTKMNSTS